MAGAALLIGGGAAYVLSDRRNLVRSDAPRSDATPALRPDEARILALASLAPSGHNAQPWFVRPLAPYHWIIGNDRRRWLPAVDPHQRETLLSLGAFLQTLEDASNAMGYACGWALLAKTNQDPEVMEVKLVRSRSQRSFDLANLKGRRTLRTGFEQRVLEQRDVVSLVAEESNLIRYLPSTSPEARLIGEQTLEANRLQAYRDPAQQELSEWVRFSTAEALKERDGLTTGAMGITGFSGWVVRNFYTRASVMKKGFREQAIAQVREQVSASAGWITLSSEDGSAAALIETGRRMQRLFLKVRERGIGLHPMSQILEEPSTQRALPAAIGLGDNLQFILRVGYTAAYAPPVSLRRPVAWFLRA